METTQESLFVKMAIMAWDTQNGYLTKLINTLPDEQLTNQIAPGKNTGIYLLGHLIAVSDGLLLLLGFGDRLYPEMEQMFLRTPDKSGLQFPSVSELKHRLEKVNAELNKHFQSTDTDGWFSRHMSVSPEDFAKEPYRNRLNVVLNRTSHMANHIGQMLLLK